MLYQLQHRKQRIQKEICRSVFWFIGRLYHSLYSFLLCTYRRSSIYRIYVKAGKEASVAYAIEHHMPGYSWLATV